MDERGPSDGRLAQRAGKGDTDAFAELVVRHQDYIYNAVMHLVSAPHDAEDIAQEVFMRAFRSIGGFRREAEFSTWVYGIMLNCVRNHWRRQGRRKDTASFAPRCGEDDTTSEPTSPDDGPSEMSQRSETVAAVRRAIDELDVELREVIVLRDIEGQPYEALARIIGVPLGTVKSRLFRARHALKERISPGLAADL